VLEQRLNQIRAAMHLKLGTVLLLERADPLGHLALDQLRVLPLKLAPRVRGHVLGRLVKRLGAGSSLWGQWAAKIS
jgi:ABC-type molybdate transport system permease subunit